MRTNLHVLNHVRGCAASLGCAGSYSILGCSMAPHWSIGRYVLFCR